MGANQASRACGTRALLGKGRFIWVLVNEHGPTIELGAYGRVFEENVT